MRVFVCEYVTGGGFAATSLPPELCREGDMMLTSLIRDLAAVPDVEVVSPRDSRLPASAAPAEFHPVERLDQDWAAWRRLAAGCDALWPIAPESGGVLERLSRLAEETGCRLLGSRPAAVRLTAGKQATLDRLAAAGLPVVPCARAACPGPAPDGWVVKPDDGAGCEETRLFRGREDLDRWLRQEGGDRVWAVQPYLPGEAGSLSILCRDGEAWLLACNRQNVVVREGEFRYLGNLVAGFAACRDWGREAAARLARAVPGLWGYVGLDFVLAAEGPRVLEVNPRLTLSYVGLRRALRVNPAALVLGLLDAPIAALAQPLDGTPVEVCVGGADG